MDDGHEQALTNSVELFWVTGSQMEEKGNLIKEVSWLDYGHQGMQVGFIYSSIYISSIMHMHFRVMMLFQNLPAIYADSVLLQVWYPSHGANPFRQEDFLQVLIFLNHTWGLISPWSSPPALYVFIFE
jgi:hypothetical protein